MNIMENIFLKNAKSLKERREIFSLTESEKVTLGNNMVTKLYKSVLSKNHINYEQIPQSKGDITKYSGYSSMVETLDLLKKIANNNGQKISEIDIVEKAINNIIANRNVFEKGYSLNKSFIIMTYNVLVYTCVSSISYLIVSYVEYIKRTDTIEFSIIDPKYGTGYIGIKSLDEFNKAVSNGEFSKSMNSVIKSGVNESVTTVAAVAAGIILGSITIVNIIRRLIFHFYYTKMSLSKFLELQAMFLELNKNNLNAKSNRMPPDKRKQVIKKQDELIRNLRYWADKLKVDSSITNNMVESEIKKENSGWKLDNVKSETASTDNNGFVLI